MAHNFKHRRGMDANEHDEIELRKDSERQRRQNRRAASEASFLNEGFAEMLAEAGIQS